MAEAYNPNCCRGRDQEDCSSRVRQKVQETYQWLDTVGHIVIQLCREAQIRIEVQVSPGMKKDPVLKIISAKESGIEGLLSKHKTLNLIPQY